LEKTVSTSRHAAAKVFDVCFGSIAPILCVIFDPAFSALTAYSVGRAQDFRLYAYAEIGIGMLLSLTFS